MKHPAKGAGLWLLLAAGWLALLLSPGSRTAAPSPEPVGMELLELKLSPKSLVRHRHALERARTMGYRDAVASEWIKATLSAGGRAYPCRIRLRGDYFNHWVGKKISLRVRLRGDVLYRGAREFNLIIPSDRSYFLEMASEWWSRRLSLVPCTSRMVWVTLAGESLGAYVYVEELGKEQLEREGAAYAPVYKALSSNFHGAYRENRRLVYSLPYWRTKCRRAPNHTAVNRLLAEVLRIHRENPTFSEDDLRRLGHLLDLEKWARFSALCRLMGSHPEAPHNQVIYFNSASGLFEPIFLDPEGGYTRTAETFEATEHMTVITRELLTVRAFRQLRDRWLETVLQQVDAFAAEYDSYGRWISALDQDPLLMLPDRSKQDPSADELVAVGVSYKGFYLTSVDMLRRVLASTDRGHDLPPLANQVSRLAHVSVDQPLRGPVGLTVRHGFDHPLTLVELLVHGPGRSAVRKRSVSIAIPVGEDVRLELEEFDPSAQTLEARVIDAAGASVQCVVGPPTSEAGMQLGFLDRPLLELVAEASDLVVRVEASRRVIPAGDYTVRGVLVVPRGPRLVFEAGARLHFAQGASLLSYAPITVEGTAERPVVFDGLDPARGWGLVGVLSTRAWDPQSPGGGDDRRSTLRHLVVAGARGATVNGVTYTGGLSFLYSDVSLERCVFVDVGGDDALNVKLADVRVRECLFLRSPQDAIDLDSCSGEVVGNVLLASGGDGVDLSMAKELRVSANVILGVGDKGVSVGEASKATLETNLLAFGETGVASKDLSMARLKSNRIVAFSRGLTAYRKKPIFGGGRLLTDGDRLLGCDTATWADDESSVSPVPATSPAPGALDANQIVTGLKANPAKTTAEVLQALGLEHLSADWPWSLLSHAGRKP